MMTTVLTAIEVNQYYRDIKNGVLAKKPRCLNVAIISSATVDPFVPALHAYAYLNDISLDTYIAPFNQVQQTIFAPDSVLYKEKRDLIILDVDLRTFYPSLGLDLLLLSEQDRWGHMHSFLHELQKCFEMLTRKTSATICVNNFFLPAMKNININAADAKGVQYFWLKLELALCELVQQYSNVILIDQVAHIANIGKQNWFDPKFYYLAGMVAGQAAATQWAMPYVAILRALAGKRKKCLVLDLDNTLWGGVIGEEGLHGIKIGGSFPGNAFQDFQRQCLALYHQGIMLALCSKNNLEDVKIVFEQHPDMVLKWEHFLVHAINWQDKVTNIRAIAQTLNIGTDAIVFMDDNPIECEQVRIGLPEVAVVQAPEDIATLPGLIASLDFFDTMHMSLEDKIRNASYVAENERVQAKDSAGSLEEFLSSLNMRATLLPLNDETLSRSAQLLQKTNQFNLTTRRHSLQFLNEIKCNPKWFTFTVRLVDKFGDYGQIGLVLVERTQQEARIDTFLMSCRVMGRTLEFELMEYLKKRLQVRSLIGEYIKTEKNLPVSNFYNECGFQFLESQGEVERYILDESITQKTLSQNFIQLESTLLDA